MSRAIAWMARNGVAANLLMLFLLAAGAVSLLGIRQEVFPEFALDRIQVRVDHPGATPEEVEEGVVRRVEEAIEGVDGIRRLTSVAAEGVGVVVAELRLGTDVSRALDDIKAEVDRITSFPEDAEEPEVQEVTTRYRVMEIALYGDVPERTLKELAYRVKEDLRARGDVSLVEVSGVRDYEISVEVPKDALRAYGLGLQDVAMAVRRGSLNLPGGRVETELEEVLVRVEGRKYTGRDFEEIVVRARPDGAELKLGRLARVVDGFEDADLISRFNGKPAAIVQVFRTGEERVLEVVRAVQRYLEELRPSLPPGVDVEVWENEAEILQSRLSLLVRNGRLGLLLVVLALTLFLDLRLAFWTSVGILVSFMATFAVMALVGVSINMLSLFGFILAIGIVVDDAIVVGENIFTARERGVPPLEAAIRGTRRVAVPVTFAVLTTVAAFVPLLFVPGNIGKVLKAIPIIVISVLLMSLVEALFVLPHHLSHLRELRGAGDGGTAGGLGWLLGPIRAAQDRVQSALRRFIAGPLERGVRFSTRRYGLVLSGALSVILLIGGVVAGRYVKFAFLPQAEGDVVIAQLEMPRGTPAERTAEVAAFLEEKGWETARELQARLPKEHPPLVESVYTSVGRQPSVAEAPGLSPEPSLIESHLAEVSFQLLDPERRDLPVKRFEEAWRERVGRIPSARSLTFSSELLNLGAPVHVELSHPDTAAVSAAVERLLGELERFPGVFDVRSDQEQGRREVQLRLKPAARALGVTLDDLARQVRAAFHGVEALRIQRGREEVRVYVRLPPEERDALADLRDYRIRTPRGGWVPLSEVAEASLGVGASTIHRVDGRRIVSVTADVDRAVITGDEVNARLEGEILPRLQRAFPGLRFSFGGEQREQAEALGGMLRGFLLAMFAIYALLAIPFRSYVQPLVIMAAIPFGFVGAVLGHLVMGLNLGMLSLFGIVGLSGVVVNDSLVLMDFVNEERRGGKEMAEALVHAAQVRFRPILLTSLTTFLGISPLIFERSVQAQFLIPMAVSIGFGILFATAITMLVVPALAMLQHDVGARLRRGLPAAARETPARAASP